MLQPVPRGCSGSPGLLRADAPPPHRRSPAVSMSAILRSSASHVSLKPGDVSVSMYRSIATYTAASAPRFVYQVVSTDLSPTMCHTSSTSSVRRAAAAGLLDGRDISASACGQLPMWGMFISRRALRARESCSGVGSARNSGAAPANRRANSRFSDRTWCSTSSAAPRCAIPAAAGESPRSWAPARRAASVHPSRSTWSIEASKSCCLVLESASVVWLSCSWAAVVRDSWLLFSPSGEPVPD
mmetsp:Transcript_7733/g.18524  ORF Transcript_7733/g.18524 Transcript_7733/m.18524 type:complete len:242 (-) Transcript_7733:194-919(-)